jgi:hypothetical protein
VNYCGESKLIPHAEGPGSATWYHSFDVSMGETLGVIAAVHGDRVA